MYLAGTSQLCLASCSVWSATPLLCYSDPDSPDRMHVPITAQVPENIIMAEPQKKPATVDVDTAWWSQCSSGRGGHSASNGKRGCEQQGAGQLQETCVTRLVARLSGIDFNGFLAGFWKQTRGCTQPSGGVGSGTAYLS